MKIAISNIAWEADYNKQVYNLLKKKGINYIEICPSKFWENPASVPDAEVKNVLEELSRYGLTPVSMQAVLFGHPELLIFGNEAIRQKTLGYLSKIIDLASRLGVGVVVFGSPRNRLVGELDDDSRDRIAYSFFGALGLKAEQKGVTFCIEPNPDRYGADFINNHEEAVDLVTRVGVKGFGSHVDSGAMIINNEGGQNIATIPNIKHFHISQPDLSSSYIQDRASHEEFADNLKKVGYNGYCSIEMLSENKQNPLKEIEEAIDFARSVYK